MEKSRQAAAALAAEDGSSVQVIDLRSLLPWDQDLVAEPRWPAPAGCWSSTRTSLTSGFGAEVAAWVGEHCFGDLDAPGRAGWAPPTPTWPTSPTLEQAILPQVDDIADGRPGAAAPSEQFGVMAQRSARRGGSRRKAHPVASRPWWCPIPVPARRSSPCSACGVCHTDLHYREGAINDDFPFLLGHEAAGHGRSGRRRA